MVKRKLTTIFCADVHSFGKMMARDETATLARLQRYRTIMENCFAKRDGRKVNTWGDAVIGEFSSVVEAVRCSVEIQEAITAENRDLPESEQMWFRIGINLGDVMDDGGDIYGDGVNIASRLESLAEPGGILVSESVYDFTHKQLAIAFDFAGPQRVKDNEDPVKGYRVRVGTRNTRDDQQQSQPVQPGMAFLGEETETTRPKEMVRGFLRRVEAFLDWFPRQERKVRVYVSLIGFFFAINVLFSGIADPWFILPSLPFILLLWLHFSRKRARGQSTDKSGK
ncbi:MAG: adenylate/guanylate cyclase domain-containing protein [Nitratireductor sp.]